MTSERSAPEADLGARLRATAHDPEDHAAAALRARLRHKMFGVGVSSGPDPALPLDVPPSRVQSSSVSLPVLGWIVPSVAVLALAAMMLWQRHGGEGRPHRPVPIARLPPAARVLPEAEPDSPPANEGPKMLAAAQDDPVAVAAALRASWADIDAPERLDATIRLAQGWREQGDPRRAIGLLRTLLDELELGPSDRAGRARLLAALASAYETLGRESAAAAVRAEAQRLDPVSPGR